MKFYREKAILEFDDKKVELYELNIKSLLKIVSGEYKDNFELIADNSNLDIKDFENMRVEAFDLIEAEFMKINEKHFSKGGEDKMDKKKS